MDSERVQCTTKADCTSRGSAFANSACVNSVCEEDPTWACLSQPPVISTQSPPYKLTVAVRDLITQMPVQNAQIKLCRKIDVDCAAPVGTAASDADGGATFTVDMMAFSGYLLIQDPPGFLDTLYFFNPPIDHDQTIPPISFASPNANFGLLLQLGSQMIAGRGNVVVTARDCAGRPAGGVSYASPNADSMSSQFYIVGDLPSGTATQTEGPGYGGFVNVPAGATTITATLGNPRTELGTISLLVRDGAITYTEVVPIGK